MRGNPQLLPPLLSPPTAINEASSDSSQQSSQAETPSDDVYPSPYTTPSNSEAHFVKVRGHPLPHRFISLPSLPPPSSPLPPIPSPPLSSPAQQSEPSKARIQPAADAKPGRFNSPQQSLGSHARLQEQASSDQEADTYLAMYSSQSTEREARRPSRARRNEDEGMQRRHDGQATSSGPSYSKFGSPFDSHNPTEMAFGSYAPSPAALLDDQRQSPTFSPRHGPMLLSNSERSPGRRGPSSQLRYPGEHDMAGLSHHHESRPTRLVASSRPLHKRYRDHDPAFAAGVADDIVMADGADYNIAGKDDDDYEDDGEGGSVERLASRSHRRQSAPQLFSDRQDEGSDMASHGDTFEPAWNDEASCVDGDELQPISPQPTHLALANRRNVARRQSRERPPVEEAFEVAALRRQVEQLQMALKRQMVTVDRPKRAPLPQSVVQPTLQRSHQILSPPHAGVCYPFGIPSPDTSRESSTLGGRKATSSRAGQRDFYDGHYVDHYQSHQVPSGYHGLDPHADLRHAVLDPNHAHVDADGYSVQSARQPAVRQRVTSDPPTMSSLLADESASAFFRGDESQRMEELAKKIEALEKMFQSSAISPPVSETGSQQPSGSSQNYRRSAQRTPSLSTISTRETGTYGRSRSPAASAFNYNATPYSRDSTGSLPSGTRDTASSVTVNRRKKGVARFIMGVGVSRGNVERDAEGNPLPTMQVSWSRKRTEKVAKPVSNAKMKVGPGRGRIVMLPKPDSGGDAG